MLPNKVPCWLSDIVSSVNYQEILKELSTAFANLEWKTLFNLEWKTLFSLDWKRCQPKKAKLPWTNWSTKNRVNENYVDSLWHLNWLVKHVSTNFIPWMLSSSAKFFTLRNLSTITCSLKPQIRHLVECIC